MSRIYPAYPSGTANPTIRVTGSTSGDLIELHGDSNCTSLITSQTAVGGNTDFVFSGLSLGSYTFYSRARDNIGNYSNCSSSSADYTKVAPQNFVSRWQTFGAAESVTLPIPAGYSYNFTVDWGDGSPIATVTSDTDPDRIHTYAVAGVYTVEIAGDVEAWSFGGVPTSRLNFIEVLDLGNVGWLSFEGAFLGCTNLINLSGGDTSRVTSFREMFSGATNATPNTSGWDTTLVNDMYRTFYGAANATPDTTNWDVSNVTTMREMFRAATLANPNTASWDTSSVTTMFAMFREASNANPNTTNWNVSNVVSMSAMFRNATNAAPNTSNWNTSSTTDLSAMFRSASAANPDVSNWNVSNVADFNTMFQDTAATPNTSGWVTSSATNMSSMFRNNTSANPDVTNWDISNVISIDSMFRSATAATPDTSNWITSSVVDMNSMFRSATNANPDVTDWDVSNVTDMSHMFRSATSANPDMSGWNFASVTNMANMFTGTTLPTTTYSQMLIAIDNTSAQTSVTLDGGSAEYNAGSAAARANLVGVKSWTINDGGPE